MFKKVCVTIPKIFVPTGHSGRGVLEIDELSGKILGYFDSGLTVVPPIIHDGKIIIATWMDGIKAYDLDSREQIWHLSLEKNEVKSGVWSGFSFDVDTQLAYAVTGSNGGLMGWYRTEPTLDNSLIAFNVKTGEIEWIFQHIKHDIWDLDVVSNPIIFTLKKENVETKAVLTLSKTGDIILLNALNGEPIHENSFEMISVEKSDIPREKTSPFQRKILLPEPFSSTFIDLINNVDFYDRFANYAFPRRCGRSRPRKRLSSQQGLLQTEMAQWLIENQGMPFRKMRNCSAYFACPQRKLCLDAMRLPALSFISIRQATGLICRESQSSPVMPSNTSRRPFVSSGIESL